MIREENLVLRGQLKEKKDTDGYEKDNLTWTYMKREHPGGLVIRQPACSKPYNLKIVSPQLLSLVFNQLTYNDTLEHDITK